MANKLIHKRSSVITDNNPKLPQADSLEFGEMAINYADGYETISFKNTENEIIEFRSKKYFENIISENEEVVSQALNDLNTRVDTTQEAYAAADDALKVYVEDLIDGLDIPTNLSELTNDVPFVTQGEFNSLYNTVNSKQDNISDLEDIRQGASKGATALQSYTEQYKGTVTGVKINGTTKNPSSGVVDLGTVITSHQDISGKQDKLTSGTNIKTVNNTSLLGSGNISVGTITAIQANGTSVATSGTANIPAASTSAYGVTKLSSSISSTSTTLAATASAVKAAYDLANGKQDKLVSGTNIKTINGTSILGSGDITISGGGGSSSGSGAYPEVDGSIYKEEDMLGNWYNVQELMPNTFYVFPECDSLGIHTFGPETAGVANEYLFQFTSSANATATSLTLPGDIKWANDTPPTIEPNMIYQVSILKGLASVLEFSNTPELIENKATLIDDTTGEVRFDYPVASNLTVTLRGEMTGTVNFVNGQQTATANYASRFEPYVIYSISIQSDNTYIYTF